VNNNIILRQFNERRAIVVLTTDIIDNCLRCYRNELPRIGGIVVENRELYIENDVESIKRTVNKYGSKNNLKILVAETDWNNFNKLTSSYGKEGYVTKKRLYILEKNDRYLIIEVSKYKENVLIGGSIDLIWDIQKDVNILVKDCSIAISCNLCQDLDTLIRIDKRKCERSRQIASFRREIAV